MRDALFLGYEVEHQLVGKAKAILFGVEESPRHVRKEEQETHRVEQHDLRHKLRVRTKGSAGKDVSENIFVDCREKTVKASYHSVQNSKDRSGINMTNKTVHTFP